MKFTVPQFIERETPIVGPLTFRQVIFIGGAGVICFILYFTLAKTHFLLFLVISIVAFAIAISLAFVQIGGRSLPVILTNFFKFNLKPKTYLWQRRTGLVMVFKKEEKKEEEIEEELPLKTAAGKSRLTKIKSLKGLY